MAKKNDHKQYTNKNASKRKEKKQELNVMYANVRGIKSKKTGITEILQQYEPHIFLISETQLRSDMTVSFVGYTCFHRKREGKVGGGVGILIRNDFRHSIAPHISDRAIEIMWISVFRGDDVPLIIGVYYGKQESTSRNEIDKEMTLLTEEIIEMTNDGEILLVMDGNARIGLLNEPISRNGKLLLEVFNSTNIHVLNNTDICSGKITRKNTKNDNEFSAIDFVLASEGARSWVQHMQIDEEGLTRVKGKNNTDHNTISINLTLHGTHQPKTTKRTVWNIHAPDTQWTSFAKELERQYAKTKAIITNPTENIDTKYKKWFNELENAARRTIGKTTIKDGKREKPSTEVKKFNEQKKALKSRIQQETDQNIKNSFIREYKEIQEKTKKQIVHEKTNSIKEKLEKITVEPSQNALWKEKRRVLRNPTMECVIVKDKEGKRHFDPDSIKENVAAYYEELYSMKEYIYHPYHTEVTEKIDTYSNDYNYEYSYYNSVPSINEINGIIEQKKNNKSTTDIKNEMLKKPGETMTTFLYPLITTIWREENIPKEWNKGAITSLYKGKGDKEMLTNYRPITTSSAIGTIIEAALDKRIESVVPFTQAQGGGQRKSSTFDHLFLLRAIMEKSKKDKKPTFFTFYDVSKAYDHANNDDMLAIMWEKGLRGKVWRILKNFCNDLHASVKTRFGNTRDFKMEIGGRQGSRITGRLFSKLMDILSEELTPTDMGYRLSNDLLIVVLLWVDDVLTCAVGEDEQENILKRVDEFAKKHRLQWGQAKCNVMRIGVHNKSQEKKIWKLGSMTIDETTSYKYLGDVITNDGKNMKNIESRKTKTYATTININSIASTEVLRGIETSVLLQLHDKITIPGLLANAESWSLSKTEYTEIEKIEYQALRNLFDLPLHIPIPALIFTFGTLYTHLRIEKQRLIYLHRILNRPDSHWTKQALHILIEQNIGWGKSIKQTLLSLDLPTDISIIQNKRPNEWKNLVKARIEIKNKSRLIDDCHKMVEGERVKKTKTKHIVEQIDNDLYTRMPAPELQTLTKQETKTILISRFRMLECGVNFKGSMNVVCSTCRKKDDEAHRLNHCKRFRTTNCYDNAIKPNFDDIYSTDINVLKNIASTIEKTWNTRNAHGSMF